MHSWYSKPDTRQNCPFLLRYTLIPYIACLLDDMSQAEEYLQNGKEDPEVQDIDYTVVLPGGLINKPVTGQCIRLLSFNLKTNCGNNTIILLFIIMVCMST